MITLEELATNSDDKLAQGFTNELITDSFLLSRMTFDDCLSSSGTSDLAHSYVRSPVRMPLLQNEILNRYARIGGIREEGARRWTRRRRIGP